ncbi:hypothetical protein [Campylobacter sp. US33a]|uniref:Integral membrane protein n=1 Tax=Campylobacter sp. CCS1377 TaxID=3158229 RepID=A0AAU7E6M3_9BACT|nr:hypothetical protein [Campylobacter sp. US33a]TEY01181.1 hypothetical protein ELQ16_08095 [Campylobacter sp. US33a]
MEKKYKSYDNASIVGYIVLLGFFVVYQIFTSIFAYMPILFGVLFCYMCYLLKEQEKSLYQLDFRWYFALAYLVFIDIVHNFYIFSSWIAFFVFYYVCADWIKTNLKIGKLVPVIFVVNAYVFVYLFDAVLSYIDNKSIKDLSFEYLIFIIIESYISYVFFKDKL